MKLEKGKAVDRVIRQPRDFSNKETRIEDGCRQANYESKARRA